VGGVLHCTPLILLEDNALNVELANKAKERVASTPVLINMVSKRVKQLNAGFRPYVKPLSRDEEKVDIALREIIEGALIAEMDFSDINE
jgi:DNA-directed RNA polymerase subunit omega